MTLLKQNQGQCISLGWNVANPADITSLVGTDGIHFLPVTDRGQYSPGVYRQMPTGGIFISGLPTINFIHPFLSDAQLATWSAYFGQNVTIKFHLLTSVGRLSVQRANAILVFDQGQVSGLSQGWAGYEGMGSGFLKVVSRFNITELL